MVAPASAVHELALVLQKAADALLAPYEGMTFAQLQVLRALAAAPLRSQRELAQAIGIDAAALCRMLPGMQRRGWIDAQPDPAHGRRRQVNLTPRGAALCQVAAAELDRAFLGAGQDAGVDVPRLVADLLAMRHQIAASMGRRRSRVPISPQEEVL